MVRVICPIHPRKYKVSKIKSSSRNKIHAFMYAYVNKKRPKPCMRWSCDLVQTAGKFLSVLTTVHPEKAGWLLPIGVLIVYRINI